jgi:glycosyltransferase involved in cell wall biosynthesis
VSVEATTRAWPSAPGKDPARRTRVLLLSEVSPFLRNNGQRVRLHHLLQTLDRLYDVTFALLHWRPEHRTGAESYPLGGRMTFVPLSGKTGMGLYVDVLVGRLFPSRTAVEAVRRLIAEVAPDVAWLDYGYLGQWIRLAHAAGVPVIYGAHNTEAALSRSLWWAEPSWRKKVKSAPLVCANLLHERIFFGQADTFVCISKPDRDTYSSWLEPGRLHVLPNFRSAADLANVTAFSAPHPFVCCVGGMDAIQNLEGVLLLLERIWPAVVSAHPDVHLYLVGRLPPDGSERRRALDRALRSAPNVIVTGEVPDTLPYVKAARLSLAPILRGSGTRTKIVESAACGTPVVSTTKGAEGLPFVDGTSIALADEVQAFTGATDRLLRDEAARAAMAASAREVFDRELGESANASRIRNIVESTQARGPRRRGERAGDWR